MKKSVSSLICLILLFQGCANLPVVPKSGCLYELNYEADSDVPKIGNIAFDKRYFVDDYKKFPETNEKYESGKGNEALGLGMIVAGFTSLGISWYIQGLRYPATAVYIVTGIALASVLLTNGIGFYSQAQNDYVEGMYLYNVLNNKEEFSKKRTKRCGDYIYPTIDFWGKMNIKAYFKNQTLQPDDGKILTRLVNLDPEYSSLNEKAARASTLRTISVLTSPVLGGLFFINSIFGEPALQDQYRAYFNAINAYDEECFCEKEKIEQHQ